MALKSINGAVDQAATFFWASLVFNGMSLHFGSEGGLLSLPVSQLSILAFVYMLIAALILTVQAGKNWAPWTMFVSSFFWIPVSIGTSVVGFQSNAIISLLDFSSGITQALGLWLIFVSPGKEWFSTRGSRKHTSDLTSKLQELAALRERGLITDADFEEKKRVLLGEF